MKTRMEYRGGMAKELRYGVTAAAILAAVAVTAALWVRDQRAAVLAVVVLGFVIGGTALRKSLVNEPDRRK